MVEQVVTMGYAVEHVLNLPPLVALLAIGLNGFLFVSHGILFFAVADCTLGEAARLYNKV